MSQIKVAKVPIEGLFIIEPTVHGDNRGYFMETYNRNDMHDAGLNMEFVQDNQNMSTKGVLRGLHFQKQFPQGKLVRVIQGSVYDVAVDIRPGSSTFKQWFGIALSAENNKQFYISLGFVHGYLVLSEKAEFCYKCTDFIIRMTKAELHGTILKSGFSGRRCRANIRAALPPKDTRWRMVPFLA